MTDNDPKEGNAIGALAFIVVVAVCFGMLWVIVDHADYIDGTNHREQSK